MPTNTVLKNVCRFLREDRRNNSYPVNHQLNSVTLALSEVSFADLIRMLYKPGSTFAFSWCTLWVSFKLEVVVNQIGTNQDWQTSKNFFFFWAVTEIKLTETHKTFLHQNKYLHTSLERRWPYRSTFRNGLCFDIIPNYALCFIITIK